MFNSSERNIPKVEDYAEANEEGNKNIEPQNTEIKMIKFEENVETKKEENNNIEPKDNIIQDNIEDEEDRQARLFDEETKELIDDKEKRLVKKFGDLTGTFGKKKLYDIMYGKKSKGKIESQSSNEIRPKNHENPVEKKEKIENIFECCGFICFRIYLFGLLYFTFYLIGLFQLIDLFDACKKEVRIVFKSFFYNTKKEIDETLVELYINSCFKNVPEFDFAFFTSILGTLPLKGCGFFFSSLFFTVINSILIIGFGKSDFEKDQYNVIDFLYILIYYVLFFITFGAISLFAHQKFSEAILLFSEAQERFEKRQNKKEEVQNEDEISENSETNNNQKSNCCKKETSLFIFLSFGIIIAYIINRGINILIYNAPQRFYEKNFINVFVSIYAGSYIISLLFYFLLNIDITLIKNRGDYYDETQVEYYRILGFLIFFEKKPINNGEKEEKNQIINMDNNQNQINKNLNDLIVYQRENSNNIIIQNNTIKNNAEINNNIQNNFEVGKNENVNHGKIKGNRKNRAKFMEICCQEIVPCIKCCINNENKNSKYTCASCKLGFRKCYHKSNKTEFETICQICCCCCKCEECCSCCKICQCCECCKNIELKETYEEEEIFCYVYQVQRKCSWLCDLLFKNNILSLIVHNIFVEIGIIGFEKKLNNNLENTNYYEDVNTIVIYLIFFSVLTLVNTRYCVDTTKKKNYSYFSLLSALFYIINIILSGCSYYGNQTVKYYTNNILILLPIAYTKFVNFIVMDTLVSILDEKNIDILSNSLILTSIFFIYDIIAFLITEIMDLDSDMLILFQFIIGFFILAFALYSFVTIMMRRYLFKNEIKKNLEKENNQNNEQNHVEIINNEI